MKNNRRLIGLSGAVLLLLGCASSHGEFNSKYLMDAVPEAPSARINFNPSQNQIIQKYLRSPRLRNDAALFWLYPDRIYLNLEGGEILSVDTADSTVSVLNAEDKAKVYRLLSQRVRIDNTAQEKGVVSQLIGSLFSFAGQQYRGEIAENGGQRLKVEIQTDETRAEVNAEATANCASAKLMGQLADGDGHSLPIQLDFSCEWLPRSLADEKVPQLLRKIQISPSGEYVFYESILYRVDAHGAEEKIITDYPNVINSTLSPDWTGIAVLRGKGKEYWIELFPLHI